MIFLRPARSTDAGKVGAILTDFAAVTSWMPILHTGAEDVAHVGKMIERGWVSVVEVDGVLSGFCACDGEDLIALYVAQGAQGKGCGAALLEDLKAQQSKLGLWTFQANLPAQRFYLKHGFVEIARTTGVGNDEGLPDIRYEWQRGAM